MSKFQFQTENFIPSVFKPNVLISCSTDANLLCVKNHLTFTDLLKPFSAVNKDVILRDSNNISHLIKSLQINFEDINNGPLQTHQVKKLQNDVVSKCFNSTSNLITFKHGDYEVYVPASTPWFEAWRQIFVQNMSFSEHEFLDRYLACIFVVSTFNNDIIDQFQRLSQQLTNIQNHGNFSSKFFNNNILRYFVLLHDQGQGDRCRADELYKSVRSNFGDNNCYMLAINSVTTNTLANNDNVCCNDEDKVHTDPWIQFLIPGGNLLTEMVNCSEEGVLNIQNISKEDSNSILNNEDPLMLFKSSLDEKDIQFTSKPIYKSGVKYSTSYPQLNFSDQTCDVLNNSLLPSTDSTELTKVKSDIHKPHGQCLTPLDHEQIRQFVFDFVSFGLMPWVEMTLKQLSDQISYKLKMTRGFFTVTKKFFGGNSSHVKSNQLNSISNQSSNLSGSTSNISTTGSTRVVYTSEAIEMQMRRYADLGFLFQQYELAYQTYNVLKKDFQDDAAWLHCAGAMEMSALSIFLQGSTSQRQYPQHYMDSAINIYLTHCRNIDYATRTALLNCEALKSQGLYLQASNQFIKLTTESSDYSGNLKSSINNFKDNDLRSALLLEQSAHFYLQGKVPMLRKYAFHLILAGHRFSKAGQKKHTIRCYTQALPIFKEKGWNLAQDHIFATISKHAYFQKQLETSLEALYHLLSKNSRQPSTIQTIHLRDFLKIKKEYLESLVGYDKELINGSLPVFQLPILDLQTIKVMFGLPTKSYEDISFETKDFQFSDADVIDTDFKELESSLIEKVASVNKNHNPKSSFVLKNKDLSISVIGEPITVQVFLENPLNIPLILTNICLLWQFTFDNSGNEDSFNIQYVKYMKNCPIITNEIDEGGLCEIHEFVSTEIHSDLCLLPSERKPMELSIIPKALGILKITGLAFYLNSGSPNQCSHNYFNQSTDYGLDNDVCELPILKLRGKLILNITQKNFQNSKNKLELIITPNMPKLKAVFSEFPKTMIIDEVTRLNITLTNIGKEGLKNLMLAVNPPDFLTFGLDEFCHSITNKIYQNVHLNKEKIISKSNILNEDFKYNSCHIVNLGNDNQLLPRNSVTLPIWIRFHNLSCEKKTVKFLFYYESVSQHPYLSYRLLRHKAEVDLRSNMRFQGQFIRPKGMENHCFFINMKMENQNYQIEDKETEFEIYQITSISRNWQFDQDFCDNNVKNSIRIRSKETHSTCFKLKSIDFSDSKNLKDIYYFSDLILDSNSCQYVNTVGSPCSDFFYLHYYHNKSNQDLLPCDEIKNINHLFSSSLEDIYIIVLWRAIVHHASDHQVLHEGQSHIFSSINDFSNLSGDNIIKQNNVKPMFETNKKLVTSNFDLQPLLRYSKIININHKFKQKVKHNFNLKRKLIIPVLVILFNTSKEDILVRLEPLDPPELCNDKLISDSSVVQIRSDVELPNSNLLRLNKGPDIFSRVLWIGLSCRQFLMKADSSIKFNLKCIVTKPGVYEVHSLMVKAAVIYKSLRPNFHNGQYLDNNFKNSSELPFIKQENSYSSILIVTQDPVSR